MTIFYQVNIKQTQTLAFQLNVYLKKRWKSIVICGDKVDNSQKKMFLKSFLHDGQCISWKIQDTGQGRGGYAEVKLERVSSDNSERDPPR